MTNERIKAQLIQTAFVWGFSLCMIAGLVSMAGSMAPEAFDVFTTLKGALNANH